MPDEEQTGHDEQDERDLEDQESDEPGGVVDLASVLYVVGGVPAMIAFFVILFGLVGACDGNNIMFPA